MITWLLKWLLPLVDFSVKVSVVTDNVFLVIKYKDTVIFEWTFDILNDGKEVLPNVKEVQKLAK